MEDERYIVEWYDVVYGYQQEYFNEVKKAEKFYRDLSVMNDIPENDIKCKQVRG